MPAAVETELWKKSLGAECPPGEAEDFRQSLVAALKVMEARAAVLAEKIAQDLPEFTVHDTTHSAALWGLADRIAGTGLSLNPTEAFVFGAAVLLHDLGMASAAYVDGLGSLTEEPLWSDTVAAVLRQREKEAPSAEEIAHPGEEVAAAARHRVLRELHAQQAERLATARWEDSRGNQYALLEDPDLRETLGPLIGKIAHSHGLPVKALSRLFSIELGAPPHAPSDWTVRPLILACLLRLADASHLDGSRAPRFLRLFNPLGSQASKHWDFQERLSQPLVREDRLVFNGSSFGPEEADAWWLCADTLAMVDRECRAVDSLLADRRQPRFAVRGVLGADDLGILAELIPTTDWTPIDAKVRVSNVVRLVERLGGRELYGAKPEIPLRELIQNGSDAVRARRVLEERPEDWGKVVVAVTASQQEGMEWLEVTDSGIGMSQEVLTNQLLDFGMSFWESEQLIEEFPGLLSSGFESVGRYGIGFFSVFMWGDDVDVISRRYDAAKADTHVLEFRGGVGNRPLLRQARGDEQLMDPGTRVRVLLDDEAVWRLGVEPGESKLPVLKDLCGWLAPASDVDVCVAAGDEEVLAVGARDWMELPMDEIALRNVGMTVRASGSYPPVEAGPEEAKEETEAQREMREEAEAEVQEMLALVKENARPLTNDDGKVVGRLAIGAPYAYSGATSIGGLRANSMMAVTGILLAQPTTASRNAAVPLVSAEALADWATEQAELLAEVDPEAGLQAAGLVWLCRGEVGDLPIARTREGFLSFAAAAEWAEERQAITVLQDAALRSEEMSRGGVELGDDVVAIAMTPPYLMSRDLSVGSDEAVDHWPISLYGNWLDLTREFSLVGALATAVGEVWEVPAAGLLSSGRSKKTEIGSRKGRVLKVPAAVWKRGGTE